MDTCGVRAIHPPPERGGFPRIPFHPPPERGGFPRIPFKQ